MAAKGEPSILATAIFGHVRAWARLNLAPRVWGRALEALKKANSLPNNFHGKIASSGAYWDAAGKFIGNIMEYRTSCRRQARYARKSSGHGPYRAYRGWYKHLLD